MNHCTEWDRDSTGTHYPPPPPPPPPPPSPPEEDRQSCTRECKKRKELDSGFFSEDQEMHRDFFNFEMDILEERLRRQVKVLKLLKTSVRHLVHVYEDVMDLEADDAQKLKLAQIVNETVNKIF